MNGSEPNGNQSYVTKDDLRLTERQLHGQQKEIKEITSTLTEIVATQKEMQGAFGHFSRDFDLIRSDIQRIFDRRSEDLSASKPNYFAWVIGGVTVLATCMTFVVTFVRLVLSPLNDNLLEARGDISAIEVQTGNYQEQAHKRIQQGNEYMGLSTAKIEELRKDVDWLHNEMVLMIKNRHTSQDEILNQNYNREEHRRIESSK